MAKTYFYHYTVFDGEAVQEHEAAYYTENDAISDETVKVFLEEDTSDTYTGVYSELRSFSLKKIVRSE